MRINHAKTILALLAALMLCISFCCAQENVGFSVTKTASKHNITTGDIVKIDVTVKNNMNTEVSGTVYDSNPDFILVMNGKQENSEPGVIKMGRQQSFSLTVPPLKSVSVSYSLNFSGMPASALNKEIYLGKASFVDSRGNKAESSQIALATYTYEKLVCNYDFVCGAGENYQNCFNDCVSGSADGYCDGLADKRCDPDCSPDKDSDCSKSGTIIIIAVILVILAAAIAIIRTGHKKRR